MSAKLPYNNDNPASQQMPKSGTPDIDTLTINHGCKVCGLQFANDQQVDLFCPACRKYRQLDIQNFENAQDAKKIRGAR